MRSKRRELDVWSPWEKGFAWFPIRTTYGLQWIWWDHYEIRFKYWRVSSNSTVWCDTEVRAPEEAESLLEYTEDTSKKLLEWAEQSRKEREGAP
jgi:hypothetical protein